MAVDPTEMDELLGAYALDAVSEEERRAVEEYLLANPRARAEVQEHREVATMLAWSGMDAPDGLWDRIAGSINGPDVTPESDFGQVLSLRPARRRSWTRTVGSWVAATAAAALIAVVAVKVANDDDGPTDSATSIDQVINSPDSRFAEMKSPSGGALNISAYISADGHGYLLADGLPDLDPSRTYQLWGQLVGGDELISLGVLGSAPKTAAFTVTGEVALLAITEEVDGGVVSSTNPVVVAGSPA